MIDKLGEIADGDEKRCVYTVHANGDWGDHRCELVVEHPGSHAIGLRRHAVPLLNAIVLLTVDCDEERIDAHKQLARSGVEMRILWDVLKQDEEMEKQALVLVTALAYEEPPPLPDPPEPSSVL